MIKFKYLSLAAAAVGAMLFASCQAEDVAQGTEGRGKITVNMDMDRDIAKSRAGDQEPSASGYAHTQVTVDDLTLTLTASDNSYSKTWESASSFSQDGETVPIGNYTLEAKHGQEEIEGYDKDKPYYYGKAEIKVKENQTTAVSMSVKLSHAMVIIQYSEAMQKYLASYSAALQSAGSANKIVYSADETRPAYMKAGDINLYVSLTKPNGSEANDVLVHTFNAKPQHCYTIQLDIKADNEDSTVTGAGSLKLTVTFDDQLQQEDVSLDLSDEVMNAPAPIVTTQGFNSGEPISIITGCGSDQPLNFSITALNKLASVKLSTANPTILHAEWPAEVELIGISDSERTKLENMGLKTRGLWGSAGEMAIVQLQGLLEDVYLPIGATEASVSIQMVAIDQMGKQSEPSTLQIYIANETITISNASTAYNNFTIDIEYNGEDPANNLKVQYKNDRGTWSTISGVVYSELTDGKLTATVPTPEGVGETFEVRAYRSDAVISNTLTVATGPAIAIADNDVWATKVDFQIKDSANAYTSGYTVQTSTDGSNWNEASASVVNGNYLRVAGLNPDTQYYLRALNDNGILKAKTFTTEPAAQLPNWDMETWSVAASESNWSLYYPGESAEASAWGTNNPMTTSQGSNVAYCRISGTIPTTDKKGGSNAALLRSVGWGSGNTAAGNISSRVMKYGDTGLLHLGASRSARPSESSGVNGPVTTDDLDCGIAFASRPSTLTFYYKYSPKNSSDRGEALIWVQDASGNVIATNSTTLDSTGSYTQIELPLAYSGNAKAAKIYVRFMSTNNSSYLTKDTSNFTSPSFGNLSDGTYMGSQLYIDDIQLNY